MRVPVGRLEEDGEEGATAQDRVQGQAVEEAVQRVGAALGEVGPETVAAHVLHLVLVRQRRHRAGRVVARQVLKEEDEVGEAAAGGEGVLLEGLEVGLGQRDRAGQQPRSEVGRCIFLTYVVTRYDMYASFVPSPSFKGESTVHSSMPAPMPPRSTASARGPAWLDEDVRCLPGAELLAPVGSVDCPTGECGPDSVCQVTLSKSLSIVVRDVWSLSAQVDEV